MFGLPRLYLIAGGVVLIGGAVLWLRMDAVGDFQNKLERDRAGHLEDIREIENEIRTDSDILDCLLNRNC